MDFFALPRRDLQALCKRNGVRANMTNVAMAEALSALPAVDGIEEYVKVPVSVPTPVVEAVAADEQRREKQGREKQRRVTVKAVEADVGKGVKEDDKREQAKENPPALGVGRRGPSRRARPAPTVATPVVEPVGKAEEKQDGSIEEDQRSEANKEDAPAPVVGRRGASRRACPTPAAESAGAGAGEEQREIEGTQVPRGRRVQVKSSEPNRSDDCEEQEKEDLKQKASTDDAPTLGAVRWGPSRRARPTPALAARDGKVAEEEKTAPIPRGRRHANAKSTDEVKPNHDDDDEKQCTKPEEEADVPALGVGRRGARRARRAPAVAAPAGKLTAEVITLDGSDEENEDTKPQEKDDDATEIAVGRRGANTRAPAPEEALATRRPASPTKTEAGNVAGDAVPIRPTRQRKPTMKAAATAKEKALPKATGRGTVKITDSQEQLEKTQGTISDVKAVPALVSDLGFDDPEDLKEVASDPKNTEEKQEDEGVVITEDDILMKETLAQELSFMDQECMDYSTMQEQQVEIEKCPAPFTSKEDSPILGLISMADEQAAEKDEGDNFQDGEGSNKGSLDKGVIEEIHDAGEELELVSIIQEAVNGDANHKSEMGNLSDLPVLPHGTEEANEVNKEAELSSAINWVEVPDTLDEIIPSGCSSAINWVEVEKSGGITSEIPGSPVALDITSQDKEGINIDQQPDLAVGSVLVDCLENINLFAKEDTSDVNTEDVFSCQQGDVNADMTLPDTVAEAIPSGCSSGISWVKVEKAGEITSDMPESLVALDMASPKKEDIHIDQLQADLEVGSVLLDCSRNVNLFAKEDTSEVSTEDGFPCHDKGNLDADMTLPDTVAETIPSGCSSGISWVKVEKAGEITSDMPESPVALDIASPQKEDIHIDQLQADLEVGSVLVDCSLNVNLFAKEDTSEVSTEDGFPCHDKGNLDADMTLPYTVEEAIPSTENMPEATRADGNTKNTFSCDLPQELNVAEESDDHITPALLADVTESIITVEPTVSVSEATSVCTNSSEKKADEPVAMLKEKGLKGAKKSVDFSKLSLRQLRTKLKETLEGKKSKEAKRVALARVEENVCPSSAKGQQQNLNLRTKLKETLNAKKSTEAKRVALARVDENVCRSCAKGQQHNLNLQQH